MSAQETSAIESIVISLTDICNIKCTYCFEGKEKGTIKTLTDYDVFLQSLLETLNSSRRPNFYISFYGGEPLLQFELIKEIVAFLESNIENSGKKILWGVATNGILINQEIFDYLKAKEFDIQMSIDGSRYITDLQRLDFRGQGTYERLSFILDRIASYPRITARMTITPMNAKYFDEAIIHLIDIGFRDASHSIKFDFDYTADWSELAQEDLENAFGRATTFLKTYYQNDGRAYINPVNKAILDKKVKKDYCGAGCSTVHITPKGKVYPCNRLTPSHGVDEKIGLLSEGFILLDKVEAVRKDILPTIQRESKCETCKARNFCDLICPARVHSCSGNFNTIGEFQCLTTRLTSKLALSLRHELRPSEKVSLTETYELESIFA